jgi:DNA mismatch repair protein MutL
VTPRVQRLDSATADRIAAGEVIERPASVVKELIENAIDAASTRLDITLENGGRRLIQVTDNGMGMSAEDAELALERFTTSKIRLIDDLTHLTTLGFRGEALPSMVTMAEVELTTRRAGQIEGIQVQTAAASASTVRPIGCPVGTRVRVSRLFARAPVRLNALRSMSRELKQIHELVAHYALVYPQVTFQLQHDGRRLLFAPASTDWTQRLAVMFDRHVIPYLRPVQWQSVDIQVFGVISAPDIHRATRQRQFFWVNGRPMRSTLISAALGRAYGARLPPGRYPLAALGVTLPASLVDVNVHPRKQEVTFVHERAIFAAVQEAADTTLQHVAGASMDWDSEAPEIWPGWSATKVSVAEPGAPYGDAESVPSGWRPMGQIGNTYLAANGPEGLLLLDQHATHESLLYAALMRVDQGPCELPEPLVLTLTAEQERWLQAIQPTLTALGFETEPFGRATVLVRSVPTVLADLIHAPQLLDALQEARQRLTVQAAPEVVQEQLCAALSCRTAIRAGDTLPDDQAARLVDAVGRRQVPYTCPHGRPTYVSLTMADLERRFLRFFPLDTPTRDC